MKVGVAQLWSYIGTIFKYRYQDYNIWCQCYMLCIFKCFLCMFKCFQPCNNERDSPCTAGLNDRSLKNHHESTLIAILKKQNVFVTHSITYPCDTFKLKAESLEMRHEIWTKHLAPKMFKCNFKPCLVTVLEVHTDSHPFPNKHSCMCLQIPLLSHQLGKTKLFLFYLFTWNCSFCRLM